MDAALWDTVMTRLRRLFVVLLVAGLAAAPGVVVPAHAVPGVAGECDLIEITLTRTNNTTFSLATTADNICVISHFHGASGVDGLVTTGEMNIQAASIPAGSVTCIGGVVQGLSTGVQVSVTQESPWTSVTLILQGAPGPQAFNPTASVTLQRSDFVGTGTFTRKGSGSCSATTTWTFGTIAFEGDSQ